MTKYCYDSSSGYNGFTDNKTVLDLEDDAAHVNWGGSWRMPTDAEWTELRNNCTWTWTTQNGVNGYRVTSNKTGYTDKSIFLPAAGYRSDNYLRNLSFYGYFWSSSLYTDHPYDAWSVDFNSGIIYRSNNFRFIGCSVRPIYGDFISVEGISLNMSSLSIMEGEASQLSATVMPANATEKTVTWTSSNTSVATVSSAGVVTAVSAGSATITAWASDGLHSATCLVTVQALSPHQASSLVVTGHDVTIQLTNQHLIYTIPILETMEIRDDGGYPILTNGEWLIGNGLNGIPEGFSAKDYYEIITNISYDTLGLPEGMRTLFSFDWENNQFVFDYSKTDHISGTCSVPIMWDIRSSLGNYSCMSDIIIQGEE